MGILIGMDEAGYGPNLGPLVVAATAWEVVEEVSGVRCQVSDQATSARRRKLTLASAATPNVLPIASTRESVALLNPQSAIHNPQFNAAPDLYRLLRNIVAKSPSERRVPIADSKVLYNPNIGLRHLERGLHAVLHTLEQQLTCWSAIVHYCGADPDAHHPRVCWPDGFDCMIPLAAEANELARLGARFARACDGAGVRPLLIRARLVFPEQFNDLVAHFGNKASALSHITIGLLREVTDSLGRPSSIHAVCDKHGGRNFYTAFLQHHFSEHWISPTYESHAESHYEWGGDEARVRVCFRMNGETFLPTALASMTAKYLRELAMKAFNEFWSARIPNLRPTAGYYGDSRRFKRDIAAKQRELGIDDYLIWRNR